MGKKLRCILYLNLIIYKISQTANILVMKEIENVDLTYLSLDDYQELRKAMIESYTSMPESYWEELQIKKQDRRKDIYELKKK